MAIDSLPKLIERLRDPRGKSSLRLNQVDLESIVKYGGIDDFDATYVEFLDSVKANNTIKEVEIHGFFEEADKGRIFPIINPLLRHLPRANAVTFPVNSLSSVERFLCKDAASFTTVRIRNLAAEDGIPTEFIDSSVLRLHPDLEEFKYFNDSELRCINAEVGPVLLALPFPSKLRALYVGHVDYTEDEVVWDDEMARPFTEPEFNRLVEVVQVPSLTELSLQNIRFSSKEECTRFARGLAASPVKDLCLSLFTPDAANYRDIISVFSNMPHLECLEAILALDELRTSGAGSFSIPIGDIVRGAPLLKSLDIGQCWKPWEPEQYHDLALALEAPSCGLRDLVMTQSESATTAGVATVMSSFSSPASSIEVFLVRMVIDGVDDFDHWLSMLPRKTVLRNFAIYVDGDETPMLTRLQEEEFLRILSGWHYLTIMHTGDEDCDFGDCCLSENCLAKLDILVRLNRAGRHYLASETSSKADGVEVLIKVQHELDDLYTHLLENPCLCDRSVSAADGRMEPPNRKKPRI